MMAEATGEQAAAQAAKPLHERYGFENEDQMAEAFEKVKGDLGKYKGEARSAKELAEKLAALEAAEAKRAEAEMSETQKLAAKLAAMEKQMSERDALIAAKDRAILTERVFSAKLSGHAPEEAAVLRRLLSSAVAGQEFADEAELAELLAPVEAEYAALREKIAGGGGGNGPGIGISGAPVPQGKGDSAAVKTLRGLSLVEQIKAGQRLMRG